MEKTTFGMELYLLMAYGTRCKCELVLLTLSRGFIPKIALVKSCSVAQNVSSCYSVSREHVLSAQRWVSVLCKIYCRTPGHYLTLDLLCISKASLLLKYKDIWRIFVQFQSESVVPYAVAVPLHACTLSAMPGTKFWGNMNKWDQYFAKFGVCV